MAISAQTGYIMPPIHMYKFEIEINEKVENAVHFENSKWNEKINNSSIWSL